MKPSGCLAVLILVMSAANVAWAELKVLDVKAVSGRYGPERESMEFFPGDRPTFRARVEGIQVDDQSQLQLVLTIRVLSGDGREVGVTQTEQSGMAPLGGDSAYVFAALGLPVTIADGAYTLEMTVNDKLAGTSSTVVSPFEIKPPELAIVALEFSYDPEGKIAAPPGGVVGQTLFIKARIVGLDISKRKMALEAGMQTFDTEGNPLMPRPFTTSIATEDPKELGGTPVLNWYLTMNRAGQYTLRLSVTDANTGATANLEAPLNVTEP